jgi:hypothetical protein
MLKTKVEYHDLGRAYFEKLEPERQRRSLVKRLQSLSYHVTLSSKLLLTSEKTKVIDGHYTKKQMRKRQIIAALQIVNAASHTRGGWRQCVPLRRRRA